MVWATSPPKKQSGERAAHKLDQGNWFPDFVACWGSLRNQFSASPGCTRPERQRLPRMFADPSRSFRTSLRHKIQHCSTGGAGGTQCWGQDSTGLSRSCSAHEGIEIHCSDTIHCRQCSTRPVGADKSERYFHTMLSATLGADGHNRVPPLMLSYHFAISATPASVVTIRIADFTRQRFSKKTVFATLLRVVNQ